MKTKFRFLKLTAFCVFGLAGVSAWAGIAVSNSPAVTITCPTNLVATATDPGGATVFYTVFASGGCNPPPFVNAIPPSGSTFPIGTTTVFATASDTCGGFTNCSFTVTVNPVANPPINITCPTNLVTTATDAGGATVFYTVVASGGCSPPPSVICNPPSGSTFPIGSTLVTCMASDMCGQATNCWFTVAVDSPQYPPLVLSCASNLTVTASSSSGAVVFFSSSASGGCSPPPFLTCNPPSGSTFPIGTTLVTCMASDMCGQSTNCWFSVTVNPPQYPPLFLNCSSNLTVTASSSSGAVVFFSSSASGGCSPPPFLTCNPPSGSTFPIGTTLVTCTASDACGQSTNCWFSVTVNPPQYPPLFLNCSSNLTVTASSSSGAVVFFSSSASGGCSPPPFLSCNPPSGSTFPIGSTTVNCMASDACGQSTNCWFSVTVNPPQYPPLFLNCSSNLTVTASSSSGAVVFFSSSASGGCSPPPFLSCNPPSGSTFPIGSTTVNCMASDSCGQATNCWFTVTVEVATNSQADLSVTKIGTPASVIVGQNLTYTIVVSNAGPNTASNVISRDAIPSGTIFVSATPTGYTYYPNFLRVDTAPFTLPSGGTFTWRVTVQVTNAGSVINAANAYGDTPDPNTTNNVGWATNNAATPQADLSVTKTGAPANVTVGQNLTYTIVVSNAGPNTASNVISRDAIPSGTIFVSATPTGYTYYPNFLRVDTAPFTLPSGGTFTWRVTVQVTNAGSIINAANAYGETPDPNTTNNVGWATNTATTPRADLSLTKTASAGSVCGGGLLQFFLALKNNGPADVDNQVTVTDVIPSGYDYVSDTSGGIIGDSYSYGLGTWTLPRGIGAGVTIYLFITVRPNTGGVFTNTATVNVPAGVTDPNLANNASFVTVTNVAGYSISGRVLKCMTNGPGLSNVTLTAVGGGVTNSTVSDANGNYALSNLCMGVYTVTPVLTNYTFLPTNAVLNVTTNLSTNFIAFNYTVQGRIIEGTNGPPISNVVLYLTGSVVRTNLTDTNGFYIFTNLGPGAYTLQVVTNGYVFAPTNLVRFGFTNSLMLTNCTNVYNFVGQTKRLVLAALEVTQVIQDLSNSVSLIQNKATFVRAYVQWYTNTVAATNGFRLRGYRGGTELGGSPELPLNPGGNVVVTTNALMRRPQFTNTVNFSIPNAWANGTVDLRFEWTNGVVLPREPAGGGEAASNATVRVTFLPAQTPDVRFVAINWTNLAGEFRTNATAALDDLAPRLLSLYPISEIRPSLRAMTWMTNRFYTHLPPDEGEVNTILETYRAMDIWLGGGSTNRLYYGSIAPIANRGREISGMAAGIPGNVSSGRTPYDFWEEGRHTHGHEIGHSLGRPHAVHSIAGTTPAGRKRGFCTEVAAATAPDVPYLFYYAPKAKNQPSLGPMSNDLFAVIYGFDTLARAARIEPVVNPSNYFALMSYCSRVPYDLWPSKFTYDGLYTAINNRFPPPPARAPLGLLAPAGVAPTEYVLVRGRVDLAANTATLLPFIHFTTTADPGWPPPPGTWTLRLLSSQGQALGDVSFEPVEDDGRDDDPTTGHFLIPVPTWIPLGQVQVLYQNQLLAGVVGSAHPPTAQVFAPNGGLLPPGPVTVSWHGQDTDGDPLTYSIQYSSDGGGTWQTIGTDLENESYNVDTDTLPGGPSCLFRVIVSDGFNSGMSASAASFGVPNHAPTVRVSLPGDGDLYYADQQVLFNASANDLEDGSLPGDGIQWQSSLDGPLGQGASLHIPAALLSEGRHVITAQALDSANYAGSASVAITIVHGDLPMLTILRQGSQVTLTWPIGATGYTLQSAGTVPSQNWHSVDVPPAITDDGWSVTLDLGPFTQFFRLVK